MEFNVGSGYSTYTPMDRDYTEPSQESSQAQLEKPIVPISELGQTVPEKDPRTGAHIIQTTQAAIKAGGSKLQWVQTTPTTQAIGGGLKAYGHDVRMALKELIKANDIEVTGWEMPTASMSNMSGYNPQSQQAFSEEKRHQDMNEVRDAIRFIGQVAGGGGVDIWSQEFPRPMFDARFNDDPRAKAKEWVFKAYDQEDQMAIKFLVDDRSGELKQTIRMNQDITYPKWNRYDKDNKQLWEKHGGKPYRDDKGNIVKPGDYIDYENRMVDRMKRVPLFDFENNKVWTEPKKWEDFADEAREINELKAKKLGVSVDELPWDERVTPQEAFYWASTESQESIARAWAAQYQGDIQENIKVLEELKEKKRFFEEIEKTAGGDQEKLARFMEAEERGKWLKPEIGLPSELIDKKIQKIREHIESHRDMSTGQAQTANDMKIQREHITTAEKYAKKKSMESYAELGIYAMHESRNLKTDRPLHVGPEIGWPGAWGGHPDEFIELIKGSRKKMIEMLTKKEIDGKKNDFYDPNLNQKQAEEKAKHHIAGMFDTGHMGMWLNYFRRKPGESEEKRIKEFNRWYLEQVDKMVNEEVVGGIQAVNSATGAHAHLPGDQGIFPVVDAVKKFTDAGIKVDIVSEGHEEEQFGQSRILLETWKAFGAGIHTPGYHTVAPGGGGLGSPSWGDVQHGYFGRAMTPYFVFGAYAPSNDWTLWSNVQME